MCTAVRVNFDVWHALDPPLPTIGDAAFFTDFADDHAHWGGDTKNKILLRDQKWEAMERIGDLYIHVWVEEALHDIFGEENYNLVAILSKHANSNPFHCEIARYYKLDDFGQFLPGQGSLRGVKARADLFEAWIGFCVTSRRLFDNNAGLTDLRDFYQRLLSVRYSQLRLYAYGQSSDFPSVPVDLVHPIEKVIQGTDKLLKAHFVTPKEHGQVLGYRVTMTIKQSSSSDDDDAEILSAFSPSKYEAERMHGLALWNVGQRLSP